MCKITIGCGCCAACKPQVNEQSANIKLVDFKGTKEIAVPENTYVGNIIAFNKTNVANVVSVTKLADSFVIAKETMQPSADLIFKNETLFKASEARALLVSTTELTDLFIELKPLN